MDHSGNPGLINSTAIHKAWALHYSKFVDAYKEQGIHFWGCTVQNEPEFAAPWEACVYTPELMRDFVKKYLGPQLAQTHPDLKIMIWDHNRDHLLNWTRVIFSDPEASKYVAGTGFHWYSNGDYDKLSIAHKEYPDKFLLATEACNCPGVKLGDWERGESYGYDIINDLNNFAVGWVDWNLVLNMIGGPNHVHNYCDAPIIADTDKQQIHYQPSYFYMGHFSKFLVPGSTRISLTNSIASPNVYATCFETPDKNIVLIVQNTGHTSIDFKITDAEAPSQAALTTIPARSIRTFIYQKFGY